VELSRIAAQPAVIRKCPGCKADIHDKDARHCKYCGTRIMDTSDQQT
jgi:rRNA maturation endonuclease Nob1